MNKLSSRLSLISLCLMSAYSFSTHAEESQQTTVLDEITVTGEKFQRSQSSTGSSTSVVTATQLKREANLLSATQLLKRDVNILDTGLGNDLCSRPRILGNITAKNGNLEKSVISHFKRILTANFEKIKRPLN